MTKARNGFIKNLRYLCLVGVIALGLITIVGSNGDDTSTSTTDTTNSTTDGGGGGDGDGGDTEAPTAPTELTATAASSSQIDLSWTASTDNVGVTGYKVFRGGAEIGKPTSTSYSDTGLSASTQYCYTVKAYDAAENVSPASNEACATTLAEAASSLIGTWGVMSLHHMNDSSWATEGTNWTINNDGTGSITGTWNDNGVVDSGSCTFTYTTTPNSDGSITLTMNLEAGSGEGYVTGEWSGKLVLSDNGKMMITDGTSDTSKQFMMIWVKLDTSKTYTNTDLSGAYYGIGYMYDDATGAIKYNADSEVMTLDGNGNLSSIGTLNGDGTIQDYSYTGTYSVSTDGLVMLGGEGSGYLSGDGNLCIWSDPASTNSWLNRFYMKKGDKTYSTSDLAGTYALARFGDDSGTSFHADFGTLVCDSGGRCTATIKSQVNGVASLITEDTVAFTVSADGSFGPSALGYPSYAMAIGNNGNTIIVNRSFETGQLSYRDIGIAVRCSECSNLAGTQ